MLFMVHYSGTAPRHPASSLDLSGVTALTVAELGQSDRYLRPFHHSSAQRALREQWEQLGGSRFFGTQASATKERLDQMSTATADWARQWGLKNIVELLLDMALLYAKLGKRSVARSCLAVVEGPKEEQEQRVLRFLHQYVVWSMSR